MSEKTTTPRKVKITCIAKYYDIELKRIVEVGEVLSVTRLRAEVLREAEVAE